MHLSLSVEEITSPTVSFLTPLWRIQRGGLTCSVAAREALPNVKLRVRDAHEEGPAALVVLESRLREPWTHAAGVGCMELTYNYGCGAIDFYVQSD
jgi:hypothetical protein